MKNKEEFIICDKCGQILEKPQYELSSLFNQLLHQTPSSDLLDDYKLEALAPIYKKRRICEKGQKIGDFRWWSDIMIEEGGQVYVYSKFLGSNLPLKDVIAIRFRLRNIEGKEITKLWLPYSERAKLGLKKEK